MFRLPTLPLLVLALASGTAVAGEGIGFIDWNTETLTGDWNGARSRLSDQGANFEVEVKGDFVANLQGGLKQGATYTQNIEFKLNLDAEKLLGIADSTLYFQVLTHQGGHPNNFVGSYMGVDNMEVSDKDAKLFQAWFNRDFLDDTLSVLAGVYPVDSEFYVNDTAGVFIHPSFGMAVEVAQTGENGPSIYPLASPGLRVKYQPRPTFYAQAALMDADPGDGQHPKWTTLDGIGNQGALFIAETGYRPGESHHTVMTDPLTPQIGGIPSSAQRIEERFEPSGKYAFGFWTFTRRQDDLTAVDSVGAPLSSRNSGAYVLMEQSFYRSEDIEHDLAGFLRFGVANSDVNPVSRSTSLGLRLRGTFPGRVSDIFGIGWTRAETSDKFRTAQADIGQPISTHESVVEITYRYQYSPWLAIQPSLQRIFHPGFDPSVGDATVAMVRVDLLL